MDLKKTEKWQHVDTCFPGCTKTGWYESAETRRLLSRSISDHQNLTFFCLWTIMDNGSLYEFALVWWSKCNKPKSTMRIDWIVETPTNVNHSGQQFKTNIIPQMIRPTKTSSKNLPWWSSSLVGALWWAERYAQRVRESQPLITTMTFSGVRWDKQEHHRMIFEDTFFTWDLGPNICWFALNINHIIFRKIGVYFWGFLVRWTQVEHLLALCILWPSLIFNFGYTVLLR